MSEQEPTIGEVAPLMSGGGRLGVPRKVPTKDLSGNELWKRAADHIGFPLDDYMTVTMDFAALSALGEHEEIGRRLQLMRMDTDDMLTEKDLSDNE